MGAQSSGSRDSISLLLPTTYASPRLSTSSSTIPTSNRRRSGGMSGRNAFTSFFRRIKNIPSMDFEFALWQMLYLCISPRRVYRNIYYHKQTKNQWARDDPAFLVLLSLCLAITAVAYGIAYSSGFVGTLKLMLYMIFVDFVLVGLVVSTAAWAFSNRFLIQHHMHSVEQSVEWAYAFDVHCNSFLPQFLMTYVIQFFFIPIVKQDRWICTFLGNTIYFIACSYYVFITFLGYNGNALLLLPCKNSSSIGSVMLIRHSQYSTTISEKHDHLPGSNRVTGHYVHHIAIDQFEPVQIHSGRVLLTVQNTHTRHILVTPHTAISCKGTLYYV
ncbi:hypothetical protein SeLEV6574_g04129 [Synchytrium endobioticum]|uniref:UNC-50 family protein n=1 Tax=Synchytrium endobioticum TaxID=286115 RepID=A0A507D0V4_9FUNG|nr:hypothetical protein SeLEV6574_g04129 [Synchytrium endobioticum]